MSINFKRPEVSELKPRITVFGVGGAGGNAVNNMIRSKLEGVEFVIANTDAQALAQSPCERKIQMGTKVTEGLGAGSRPEVGCAAAEESLPELVDNLSDAHMVFITAGMGGGTGTGAAPVIARAARDKGILTVGVVTKPFQFEGARRMRLADEGIRELQQYVDTLIIIPNQNLFRVASERTTFAEAFSMADEVLYRGVRGITDLMVMPGLINLDFADVRTVMSEMGKAMMGTGEASGEKRAVEAAEAAISNPLLDEVSMRGAKGVLINITGGMDLTLFEVDEAANRIRSEVDPEANIIVGSTFDQELEGLMRISVVATGIANEEELDVEGGQDKVLMLKGRPEKKAWSSGNGVGAPAAGRAQTATASTQAAGEGHRDHPQHRSDAAPAASQAAPVSTQTASARASAPEPAPAPAASSPTHDLVRRVSEYAGVPDALGSRGPSAQAPQASAGSAPTSLRTAPAQASADAAPASGSGGYTNGSLAVAQAEPVRAPKSRLHDILSNLKNQVSTAQTTRAEPAAHRNEPAVEPSPRIVADAGGRGQPAPARPPTELGGPSVRVPTRSYVDETMEIPTFLRRPLTK